MDVLLLGPVEAYIDGRPVALGARKQRALLAMLALEAGRTVSADRLAEGLWGETLPSSAPKMVQHYVSQLRRLGADIATRGRGYELTLNGELDRDRAERLLSDGCARDALALWRGAPLMDVADEPFAASEIRQLEELWGRTAEAAVDADLDAGRHREVLAELRGLLDAEPLHERFHAQRMIALYRSGRQAEALAAFHEARALLIERIGVEPGPELRALQHAVLAQDPALELPRTTVVARRRRRRPWALAAAALLIGLSAFGLARSDDLERIDEDHLGLIDGERIVRQLPVGHGPSAAVAGAGSTWVANALDGTVSRVDDEQVGVITVGGVPSALAYGLGSVWVADGSGRQVVQIAPEDNAVAARYPAGNAPRSIAVAGGALWIASGVDQAVRRITIGRELATQVIRLGSSPTAIAASEGAIWVASEETGTVARIDARTGDVIDTISVGQGPSAIAVGAGVVWVVSRHAGTLARIDPARNAVTGLVRVGSDPMAVAAEKDSVWVAGGEDRTIVRVDPRTMRVAQRVAVGSSPAAIVVAQGTVWAAGAASQAAHRGGTLRVRMPITTPIRVPIDWLHPAGWSWQTWHLSSLAYDGLVGYRRVGGSGGATLVGALATNVPRPTRGGRTYVFTLRRGLRYSDGTPVATGDVRASVERMLVATRPNRPSYFDAIVGVAGCAQTCDLAAGIESDERARRVTINLTRPDAEFLHKLTTPFAYVVPARARGLPPGTGPYRLARWDLESGGSLVRNAHFGARPRPAGFANRIEIAFKPMGAIEAQIRAVDRGDADVLVLAEPFGSFVSSERLKALTARSPARVHGVRNAVTDWMFLNVARPPFDALDVRRAVSFAIDRARIVALTGGATVAAPTCQFVPGGAPGYEPYCPYTGAPWGAPDLRRARNLIARSGRAGSHVTVVVPEFRRDVGRYFVGLLDDLGLRASLRVRPLEEYFSRVYDDDAQVGFIGWSGDYVSAANFIAPHFTCSSQAERRRENVSRFCDGPLAGNVTAALEGRDPDPVTRLAAADRRLVDLAPAVPLTNHRSVLYVSSRVGNVQAHQSWFTLLDQLWVR